MASLALVFDLVSRDGASKGFRDVGNAAEKAGRQTSAFGSLTAKAMGAAAGAIAGIGLGRILFDATKAASDLGQSLSTSSVIFGRNAAEIDRWAKGAARSVGLSRRAATEAAIGFGDMFQQLGFSNDAATDMSTSTVQLAADLGAFRNLPTADVVEKITAAFRGEYDSLQALIPNINAARVEQEALTATGKASAATLTAQEKAAATLAIVQRDGAKAAGAFARESEGLAGSQQTLTAEWENAQVRLGELLVGPMTGIVQVLTDGVIPAFEFTANVVGGAVDVIGDIPGPVVAAVAALGGVALLKGPLSSFFDTVALKALYMKDSVAGASLSMAGVRSAGSGLLSFFGGPWGLAIAGATAGLTLLTSWLGKSGAASADAAGYQRDLASALKESNGAIDDNVRLLAAQKAADTEVGDSDLLAVAEKLGFSLPRLTDALLGNRDAYDELTAAANAYYDQSLLSENAGDPKFTQNAENARLFMEALDELAPSMSATVAETERIGEAAGVAATATTAAAQEATTAFADWLESAQGVAEGFVQPLETYKFLLDAKKEKEREAAQATADATADATDSWEDHVTDVTVSLGEMAAQLEAEITAHENWRANIVAITERGGLEVGQILYDMGEEGVSLAAQMANGTDAEFQRMAELLARDAAVAGQDATEAFGREMQAMALIGRDGSAATVQEVARQLELGVGQVREIARKYGVELADGVNPLLRGLGKPGIDISGAINSGGGRWMGGFITGPGGPTDDRAGLFALSDGEYVVRAASVSKYGKQLFDDLNVGRLATGGFIGDSDVPRPSSTAPYRWPISPPADATMQKGFDEVKAFLAANIITGGPGGPATPNGVGGLGPAAARAANYVRSAFGFGGTIGGYAYRNIAGTNVLSKHALGKAIDVMTYSNMGLGQRIADFFAGPGRGTFGVDNVIWNRRIHSGRGWGAYNGVSPHTDHPHIDFYKTGTDFVPHDGLAYLHKGEAVVPAEDNRGGPAVFHLYDTDGVLMGTMRGQAEAAVVDFADADYQRGAYSR